MSLGMENPARLTWAGEARAMFVLAWPLVVAQLAQNALFTTDVIMMGWLGPQYLAAGTLATAFFTPFLLLGGGIVSAVAPMVAQALGARAQPSRSLRSLSRRSELLPDGAVAELPLPNAERGVQRLREFPGGAPDGQ